MIRGLYTAATGMDAQQNQIGVTSNNISNVNTIGFKKDRAEFQDLMYEQLNYTAGQTSQTTRNPTGIDVGMGVKISGVQKSFLQGDLKETGNTFDIAIEGKGFFRITMPDGEIAYTRNGAFKLDDEGAIVNSSGYRLDPEIVIPENVKEVTIAKDGTVTATDENDATVDLGRITTTSFVNSAGLSPLGDSLYKETDASGAPIEGNPSENTFGSLRQGIIELSNVKLVNEMVDLITAQRAYEANSKAITTTDQMLDTVNSLKR
ncbi:flagellar basal body rod protein FlgG [Malaciobacter molluscorum LMG 25693]|uniref:Flagellar basal-body rod protein FlgG n=1 Tax=Malaciobacter molluscorum LMG 25693 TaxID=870501 RepID=A0A2G1DIY5_9BACT|nr:flagellar basal-body rod protein FlgG [Malaciobacter molluscorum]AXX93154.1 flagellar distal rod protein FlgF [Malaciobacter molluscorum LMG 25693]PHO18410.1 flagellar basal body rod protein FlgG [Malaciobacter molluscorum LMG 25693]RXJ95609.1 flagellar basal body rod protein FlgG [Malaciobacter molluscorum]